MPADVRVALKAMPAAARGIVRRQCAGDWQRVVVDHDGLTVHNSREAAQRARERIGTAPARRAPSPPVTAPQKTFQQAYQALQEHARSQRPTAPPDPPQRPEPPRRPSPASMPMVRPAASTVAAPPLPGLQPDEVVAPPPPLEGEGIGPTVVEGVPDPSFDMSTLPGEGASASTFARAYARGLPTVLGFQWLWEVAELHSMSEEVVVSALRSPQQVAVRPESVEKGYPVLRFGRGDVDVIVGFRRPELPMVIAAYAFSRDNGIPNAKRTSGGGGSRGRTAPKDAPSLVRALKRLGCVVQGEEGDERVAVSYEGRSLGRVTAVGAHRESVLNDWSRLHRRMSAIRQEVMEQS